MNQSAVDQSRYQWRHVTDEHNRSFLIDHDYTILGHDLAAGTLDMLVRWQPGGHCHIHRHTATTTVLVLEGEQHLWDLAPDGTKVQHRVRKAGDYALTGEESLPHLETGGPEGALVFFGCHSDRGTLYEILDEAMVPVLEVTMELLVEDWKANT